MVPIMRNRFRKSQGRKSIVEEEKKRQKVRDFILSQITSGQKRWSDLWKDDKMGKMIFGSKSYLSKTLDSLEKEGIIESQKVSHKLKIYSLTEEGEATGRLLKLDADRNDQLSEIIFTIAEAHDGHPLKKKYILEFITASICFELLQFISTAQIHMKAERQLKDATEALLDLSGYRFAVLLEESNRMFPNSIDRGLSVIKQLPLEVLRKFKNDNFPDIQEYISKEEIAEDTLKK